MMIDDTTTSSIGTCSDWTLSTGDGSVGSFTELNRGNGSVGLPFSCGTTQRLICIEQSRSPRPAPAPTTRKRVFVTSSSYNGALGGTSGADMRCDLAAAAGNKAGTWKAFLATATVTGPSRIAPVARGTRSRTTARSC